MEWEYSLHPFVVPSLQPASASPLFFFFLTHFGPSATTHSFISMILPHDSPLQERQLLPIVTGLLGPGPTSSTSSLPSSSSSSSVSSISATSTVSSTISTSTSTAAPSTTSSHYQVTTSGGSTITVVVKPTSNPTLITPSASSFLQNKTAAGVVFAIMGVVALVIIIALAIFAIRRRNRDKLADAISFDPGINAERGSEDKASIRSSGSDRNVQPYGFHRPYYAPGAIAPNYGRP
ncbi:hypothetical protein AX14_000246 [Amanita brunnescens Koide BX004]|nr:hypothetical protein AX14_000246 [Amanita brunnescens Koide BX004]